LNILNGKPIVVNVNGLKIGRGNPPVIIAGPCAVESRDQIIEIAKILKQIGVDMIRGGAFKPRTNPYTFQGLGVKALEFLKEASELTNLPVVTEVMDIKDIDVVYEYADVMQVGSRNMYNYSLLKELGKRDKPILLKRGMSSTVKEWALAAEYIAIGGNSQIILCERGIRTYNDFTRNTLDLAAVPFMQKLTGLPVIVDPSHATGVRELIKPMAKAAIACNADGVMIEVHPNVEKALSDKEQSLTPAQFEEIVLEIERIS
jgi:3-deoxy-7-phosphoheptulonate synthase